MASVIEQETSETSVWRLIYNTGFRFKTLQGKMYVNMESMDVVSLRISALRTQTTPRGGEKGGLPG